MRLRWLNKMRKLQTSNFKFQNKSQIQIQTSKSVWNLEFRIWVLFGILMLGVGSSLGCSSNKPAWEYMPDMFDSPALKAQKYDKNLPHHRAMREPVEGTIPRGFQPYHYKDDPEGAGRDLKNPLQPTEEILLAGEKIYKTYCGVCHGPKGFGKGSIVPPFPPPPSLHSDKVSGWTDGRLYHVVTTGQGIMPAYASQIKPEARWAAIHYVRVLQRAFNPKSEDFEAYKQFRIEQRVKK